MKGKLTLTVLAFFVLYVLSVKGTSVILDPMDPRCRCIRSTSTFIPVSQMKDIEILPSSPHCSHVEVIVTLHIGQKVCLDPKTTWVKKLIDRLLSR
uniref:interleukin-8-like n=1 Tax=Pristiophorus japonicus TaxID=55135 RepID=UPI00398EB602